MNPTDGTRPGKSRRELRQFGYVMTSALLVVAGLLWWKERPMAPYVAGVASAFLLSALVMPRILAPIEFVWMKLALLLGRIMTPVILTITFFVVITPFALVRRVFNRDPLDMRPSSEAESYWRPVETDGPATRPTKPY